MKIDVDSKFNLKEMEKMSKIDPEMFRDKTFRECMPDHVKMMKELK